MSDNGNVVPFDKGAASDMPANEREFIMATLANVMDFQEKLERGMKMDSAVIAELQGHVRDLEHDMAELKKRLPKKPAILNAQGARAN